MSIFHKFAKVKILVVGDVMLDRYWWGSVRRISPEAPVPVVDLEKSTFAPGGAANVAVNVAGLGATAVLVGSIGSDHDADTLVQLLEDAEVSADSIVRVKNRPTSVKTRVIAHSQQVVRVDQEITSEFSAEDQENFWKKIHKALPRADAVIVSDYAKGLLSEALLSRLIETSRELKKTVLVDPKGKDYSKYRGAAVITPNKREAAEACNFAENGPDLVERAGAKLLDDLAVDAVLITQGERGMTLFQKQLEPVNFAAAARKVYDVTGAGDTVIATLATAIGAGADMETATGLANTAAGLVVEQVGTSSVNLAELRSAAESLTSTE